MAVARFPNRAREEAVREIVATQLLPQMEWIRDDRRSLRERWLRYDNIWRVRHDQPAYHGRLRATLATGRRVIENWVQQLKNSAFPQSGRWFSVQAEHSRDDTQLDVMQALMRRFITQEMQVRRHASASLRQLVTLGTKPFDIGWQTIETVLPILQRTPKGRLEETMQSFLQRLGPTMRPVDLYLWYIYPYTVSKVEDSQLTFEDRMVDVATIRQLGKTPIDPDDDDLGTIYLGVDGALQSLRSLRDGQLDPDKWDAEKRRLTQRGLRSMADTRPPKMDGPIDQVSGYWHISLPKDDPAEGALWYKFTILGDKADGVVEFRRCPWWDQQPSYLAPRFVAAENEFYGWGLPAVFDTLHYFLQDTLNQTGDAITWSLNPIAGIDPSAVQDPNSIRMRPGAKWLVRRPRESITFAEPPKESVSAGLNVIANLTGLINDVANVSPFTGGLKSPSYRGRSVGTATGIQAITAENLLQVQDVLQGLEDEWLNPMLQKAHIYTLQCLDRPLLLQIEGRRGALLVEKQITRADLIGKFIFQWLGSTALYNQQVRASQMLQMTQILGRIPPQILEAQNVEVDWVYLLRTIWSEGFELRDADRLIREKSPSRTLDPSLENDLILAGRADEVVVTPSDNDQQHARAHDLLLRDPKLPEDQKAATIQHIRQHMAAMMAKQLLQQQQAQMQQMQMTAGMDGGEGEEGEPGEGEVDPSGAGNGSFASGNDRLAMPDAPGRLPSTTTEADLLRRMPRGTA